MGLRRGRAHAHAAGFRSLIGQPRRPTSIGFRQGEPRLETLQRSPGWRHPGSQAEWHADGTSASLVKTGFMTLPDLGVCL